MRKTGFKTHKCEELVPNPHIWNNYLSHIYINEEMVLNCQRCQCQNCEEFESNAQCSRFCGDFINVRNTNVRYMKFDFVRIFHKLSDIGTKDVTYWYQCFTCCAELVPLLHSVKYEV